MLGQSFLPRVGGEELGMDLLAREFTKAGHHVTVHVQHASWLKSPPKLDLPYRVVWYRKARSRHWTAPFLRRSLKRLYKSWPYDILYCRKLYPAGFAALQAARDVQVPLVLSLHDSWTAKAKARRSNPVAAMMSPLAAKERKQVYQTLDETDAIIALNEYMRTYILGVCPTCSKRLHVIPNGVDVDCFVRPAIGTGPLALQYAEQRGHFFLFMGRLGYVKGLDVLIEAFRMVAKRDPDIMLIVAGEGPEGPALRQRVKAIGLEDRIHFVGTVQGDDRAWLMQNALGFVLPSRIETFGKVTVEAFACGTPVIGSRLGGIAELIQPGLNGLLVEPGDADVLGRGMCELLDDPQGRERMRVHARATAQRYAGPTVAQQYLALFEQVVSQRQNS